MSVVLKNRLETHRGHTTLGFAPGSAPLVVDCGAHKGEFAQAVVAAWGARCHSIEASPILFETIALPDGATGYNFAVSDRDGEIEFSISDNAEASHVGAAAAGSADRSIVVPARSLAGFLAELGPKPLDVLKLDIEGAEIAALASLSDDQIRAIGQVTVEFHDFCGYVDAADVDAAIARFKRLGFYVFNFAFRTRGDVLMVNAARTPLGAFARFRIGTVERLRRKLFYARD